MKLPTTIRDDAESGGYEYFDQNIRQLPKKSDGSIDTLAPGFQDNDVDAFRHAYVSGVITQEYGESAADILGRLNEYLTFDLYSNATNPRSKNMDLWNNAVGRKYGKVIKNRTSLLERIRDALLAGELIIDLSDQRVYAGEKTNPESSSKSVIVLEENESRRNELFMDIVERHVFERSEFVAMIESGKYEGYFLKQINGIPTPASRPDKVPANNLG